MFGSTYLKDSARSAVELSFLLPIKPKGYAENSFYLVEFTYLFL